MKKQKIQLIVMLLLLAVLAAAYLGVRYYNSKREKAEEAENEPAYTVLELSQEDVKTFSFTNESGTYEFEKTGGEDGEENWTCIQDKELKMDASKVSSLLNNVISLKADDRIENVSDREQYGLSSGDNAQAGSEDTAGPSVIVKITTQNEESYELWFGDYNEVAEVYYMCVYGEPYVYILDSDIASDFDITPQDLEAEEDEDGTDADSADQGSGTDTESEAKDSENNKDSEVKDAETDAESNN